MARVPLCALALACACTFGASETATDDASGVAADTTADATTGQVEDVACGAMGSNSVLDEQGSCHCEFGNTWRNPFNPHDFACVPPPPRAVECEQRCDASSTPSGTQSCENEAGESWEQEASCVCADGQTWCAPDNPASTRCCPDPAQLPDTSTGDPQRGETSDSESSGGTTAPGTSEQ